MQQEDKADGVVVSKRTADIVVALFLMAVGALVMTDSIRLGAGWASDGPQSGYFPFYVGLLIVLSSIGTLVHTFITRKTAVREAFVGRTQFRDVLKVFIPTAVFVASIGVLGIYLASVLFIGIFMRWLGRFRWRLIAIVSLAVPFALFLLFEIWFLVPLPKGPIENLLGY